MVLTRFACCQTATEVMALVRRAVRTRLSGSVAASQTRARRCRIGEPLILCVVPYRFGALSVKDGGSKYRSEDSLHD
jgi:TPP-dependent pyruvate/acetoin dehydrogenase alpha subunit